MAERQVTMSAGQLAYTLYIQARGGLSYPPWHRLTLASQAAWNAVAEAADTRRKS